MANSMGWRQDQPLLSFWVVAFLVGLIQWSSFALAAESVLPDVTVICSIILSGEPERTTTASTDAWKPAFFQLNCSTSGHSKKRVTVALGKQLKRFVDRFLPPDSLSVPPDAWGFPSSPPCYDGGPPPCPGVPPSPSYHEAPSYSPSYAGVPLLPPSYSWTAPPTPTLPMYPTGTSATLPPVSRTGADGDALQESYSTPSQWPSEGLTAPFGPLSATSPVSPPPFLPPSTTPPPYPMITGADIVEDDSSDDWGISFTDTIKHLELRDSVIQWTPLSYQPLIRCPDCEHVTLANVVVRDLKGKGLSIGECDIERDSGQNRTVGALYFGRVRAATVENMTCANVKGATDFACLWLELADTSNEGSNVNRGDASLRISNSMFVNNSVTAGDCFMPSASDQMGFGAVLVYGAYKVSAVLQSMDVFNTVMYGNAGGFGSSLAIYSDDGSVRLGTFEISSSNFTNNKAAKHGGAIYFNIYISLGLLHIAQFSRIDNNTVGSGGNGGAFYVGASVGSLVVEGNSSVSANSVAVFGGAFYFEKHISKIFILMGSNVSQNRAFESGGAFHIHIEDTDVDGVWIEGNSHVDHNAVVECLDKGGGAFAMGANILTRFMVLNGSSVDKNTVDGKYGENNCGGGGLYVRSLGSLVIQHNSSLSNNAAGYGGGVFIELSITDGISVLQGSRVDNNLANNDLDNLRGGGGIRVSMDCPYLTVMDWSSISGNMAPYNEAKGGGVYIGGWLQKLVVKRGSQMSRNFAIGGSAAIGVGLLADPPPPEPYTVTVEISEESCVCNNSASAPGRGSYHGAMYFQNTRVTSFNVTNGSCVCGNRVSDGDGYGGAVFADYGFGNFTVCHNSGLSYNLGGNGGAVYFREPAKKQFSNLERFELCDNSHMDGNQARNIGGALNIEVPTGQIIVSNSSISHNSAMITGGAVSLTAMFQSFSVSDSQVYNNSVVFAQGGFLSLQVASGDDNKTATDFFADKLPSDGPFYLNITRSNLSKNTAIKDGGAISMDLQVKTTSVYNDTLRAQLQRSRVFLVYITDTLWNNNWAHYGAGGALAFVSITPVVANEQRLASVLLGTRIIIKNSNFSNNTAGDTSSRFLFAKDISPLRGNGGALFVWAAPFPLFPVDGAERLSPSRSGYVMYDDISHCGAAGMRDRDLSCWPRGSQSCGIRLEGVTLEGNVAKGGYGGGLLGLQCAAKIINCTFNNNSATLDGGGLAFMDYSLPLYAIEPMYTSVSDSGSSTTMQRYPPTVSPRRALPPPPATGLQSNSFSSPSSSSSGIGNGDIFVLPWMDNTLSVQPSVEALQNIDASKPQQQPWLIMTHTAFKDNMATNGGGAFLEINASAAIITDCDLMHNQAQVQGGGIMLIGASNFGQFASIIRGTNFTENGAGTLGGGLAARLTKEFVVALVLDGTFKGNSATRGGGVFNSGVKGSSFLVWNCTLQGNIANFGGGVALDYVFPYAISRTVIIVPVFNTSGRPPPSLLPPSPGPAPLRPPQPPPSPPPINSVTAFNPSHARVHFLKCKLTENQGILNGGAFYIAADRQNVLAVLEQSDVSLNRALLGGGLYLNLTRACTTRISNCNVSNNTAQLEGGGAYSATECGGQLLVGNGSNWIGNSAGLYGGAIMVVSADAITAMGKVNVSLTVVSGIVMPQSCLSNLNVSDSTITGNTAQEGGGIYAYKETVIMILGTALVNNTAFKFGGAIAVVNCNLLNLVNSSISSNTAAFCGGGIFNNKCAIFVMELVGLTGNSAATGGGIHVVGNTVSAAYGVGSNSNTMISRRRLLQTPSGFYDDPSATSGIVDNPVAILSRVGFNHNTASVDFGQLIGAAASESPSSSSSAANDYQSYQGYGGAMFISGHVGVAVDGCTVGPANSANVGTVLATTQACAWATVNMTRILDGSRTAVEKVAGKVAKNWNDSISTLSRAVREECSVVMLSETNLPSSSTTRLQQQASGSSRLRSHLPLIWLQDLSASALLVNCSTPVSSANDQKSISQLLQNLLQARATGISAKAPPPAPIPSAESSYGGNTNLLSFLTHMLHECRGSPDELEGAMALAVPATHMRLISFDGLILVPAKGGSSSSSSVGTAAAAANGTAAVPYLTSVDDGSTFRGKDIEALVIAPNTLFDLSIQLYDGLGQPVTVDTPTFSVSLSIRPNTNISVPTNETFALLLSEGFSKAQTLVTNSGVASWTALKVLGWPGKYVLEATAVVNGGTSSNSAFPPIANLQISMELLPCGVGSELVKDDGYIDVYSCGTCRRDRAGLWRDRRLPLSELFSASNNLAHATWANSKIINKDLTSVAADIDDEFSCPSCCQACPTNAICPGGALLLPAPGYWHSAPNSPWMHRCPQPSACGKVESFGDELDGFWGEVLMRFNLSSSSVVQNVTLNITDPSSVEVVAMSSDLDAISLDTFSMIALRNNNRSLLLAVCQQWWYENYPPNRDDILRQRYSIQPLTVDEAAPCYLFNDPFAFGNNPQVAANRSYRLLQCATGYTGHLCAACLPGYSIAVDFSCMECPSLARTIVIGLLAFWGTVVLILFTTFSNMSLTRAEAMAAEEFSSLDLLKTLITHVQYFIIITKLGINYPSIITKYQSVFSSLTGSENFIAYSPSCLFKNLASAGQAATQIAFGFAAPCTAVVVSLIIWAFRYVTANQNKFRRVNASRWNKTAHWVHEVPSRMEPSQQLSNFLSKEDALENTRDDCDMPSKAGKTGCKGHPAATAATATDGIRRLAPSTAEPVLASVNSSPSTLAMESKPSGPRVSVGRRQDISSQGISPQPSGASCRPEFASTPTTYCSPSSGPPLLYQSAESAVVISLAPSGVDATAGVAAPPSPKSTVAVSPLATRRSFNSFSPLGHNHATHYILVDNAPQEGGGSSGIALHEQAEVGILLDSAVVGDAEDAGLSTAAGRNHVLLTPADSVNGSASSPRRKVIGGEVLPPASAALHHFGRAWSLQRSACNNGPVVASLAGGSVMVYPPGVSSPGVINHRRHHMSPSTAAAAAARQTAVLSAPGSSPLNGRQHNGFIGAPSGLPHSAGLPLGTGTAGYPNSAAAASTAAAGNHSTSDELQWNPTPFSVATFGPEDGFDGDMLVNADEQKEDGAQEHDRACSCIIRAFKRYANPLHLLLFADQSVSMLQQLEVVLIVAIFILYPSLCQISLSIFSCYKLDPGTGMFKENQQATWPHGYWVRNMEQECYSGVHKRVYVPIGIAAVLLFCFCPPIIYLILTTMCRRKPNDPRMRIQYGFLYQQYKPEFFWWASMRQLQVLALVAVEVFGRGLPVQQQALMLLSVLIVIAAINTSSSPERFHELLILEFLSMCVLSLTLTLGLYFVGDREEQLSTTASTAVGAIILAMNACFIVGVLGLSARRSADRARQMHRILSHSWNSVVTTVSRAIVRIEQRYSITNTSRGSAGRSLQGLVAAGASGSLGSGGNLRQERSKETNVKANNTNSNTSRP